MPGRRNSFLSYLLTTLLILPKIIRGALDRSYLNNITDIDEPTKSSKGPLAHPGRELTDREKDFIRNTSCRKKDLMTFYEILDDLAKWSFNEKGENFPRYKRLRTTEEDITINSDIQYALCKDISEKSRESTAELVKILLSNHNQLAGIDFSLEEEKVNGITAIVYINPETRYYENPRCLLFFNDEVPLLYCGPDSKRYVEIIEHKSGDLSAFDNQTVSSGW